VRVDGGYGTDEKILATGTVGFGGEPAGGTLSYTRDQIDGFDAPAYVGNAVFIPSGSDSTLSSNDVYATFDFDPSEKLALRTLGGVRDETEDFGAASVVATGCTFSRSTNTSASRGRASGIRRFLPSTSRWRALPTPNTRADESTISSRPRRA
jgi:hypothetical protein